MFTRRNLLPLILTLSLSGCALRSIRSASEPRDAQSGVPVVASPSTQPSQTPLPPSPAPSPTASHTPTAQPTPTATATSTATASAPPTLTSTATPTSKPTATPTPRPPTATATAVPSPVPSKPPAPQAARVSRLVLGNYFAWYDGNGWDSCNISAGDKPLQTYNSDDPGAIGRHVRMALDAGIDGFTLQWYAPGERTDRNLGTLLDQSKGTAFRSTVIFLRHIYPSSPGPDQGNTAEAIRYLAQQRGSHPNFLSVEGKPVIIFADVPRVPLGPGQTPQQAWAAIRAQADPQGKMLWIAEGLDPSYLEVFDGLYVYKITHADYPDDYVKASRWAAGVRQWEARTGTRKLWIGTITPGWDDLRAGCRADIRAPSKPHKRDRENGAFYRATFDAALQSAPDWLWVCSLNEWVEGSYIEPSVQYGDSYMKLTREFARLFKGQ